MEEGVDKVELWWQWSKSHVSGKLFGTLTNGTTTTYDATTGRQVTSMTNPSDGDDDTIPTTMITDTRNYTINWFWPRIAVLDPNHYNQLVVSTIWDHDNDTKRNNQLLSISFISTVLQQTQHLSICFGRTRQSCAATRHQTQPRFGRVKQSPITTTTSSSDGGNIIDLS